ncbi:hypothetical protein [Streptomyces sp. NPDC058625]|uniref:hypothetical protein n=1 Tax=Streptomyces sp. NPDC058625 TaxID=3346564 RepID=UPI00364A9B72
MEKRMTKNGSNGRKSRIRAQAKSAGTTYRRAAKALDGQRDESELLAQRAARMNLDELAEIREVFVNAMWEADLPEMVQAILYVLSGRLNTGRLIDPNGVRCSRSELAALTGLSADAANLGLHLAEARGWVTEFHDNEARLTIPGEDASLWEHFLEKERDPVQDVETYERVHDQIREQIEQSLADRASLRAALMSRATTSGTVA